MTTDHHNSEEERYLDAFRYLHGEMDHREREAFESQLADNADLCEILSEAVTLESALRAVQPRTVGKASSSNRNRFIGAISVALFVLIAIPLVPQWEPNQPQQDNQAHLAADAAVAALWVATAPIHEVGSELKEMGDSEVDDAELTQVSDIPDWLFAVVEASKQDAMEDMDNPTGETL